MRRGEPIDDDRWGPIEEDPRLSLGDPFEEMLRWVESGSASDEDRSDLAEAS